MRRAGPVTFAYLAEIRTTRAAPHHQNASVMHLGASIFSSHRRFTTLVIQNVVYARSRIPIARDETLPFQSAPR
jgi:hypothetical protein